ncbi:Protein of uncharacterised function (DUF805) [Serratia liquefaciens]|jgi:uncharacterized membrane protein YhaH (DUF805 family)|nr:Protein of uncharacterised function (DUF805) [Serratia liquefaciens]CAI1012334.1 Protein of uncharacterised function (DUF805) [Serratia liquefaciens]CAI1745096.1 Protein of uncharacterised function (DUF805) [Serratia liquefaciens]
MKNIFQDTFLGFKEGRLKRLRYFLYTLVSYTFLSIAFYSFISNPKSMSIIFVFILTLIIFMYLSILFLAKRFRDMGLPPLISSLVYWAFFFVLSYFSREDIYYAIAAIISLAICLSPSNSFAK